MAMSLPQEQLDDRIDSSKAVEATLERDFELHENGLNSQQLVEFLANTIATLDVSEQVKVVSLVGGAASGKSTLSERLLAALGQMDLEADVIGTDDFIRGDRDWRWAHFEGDNPQPPIGKYDFALLNSKIQSIKANRNQDATIPVPTYDQATGLAVDAGEENYKHRIGPIDVLIVEGDFHPTEEPDMVVFLHVDDETRLQNRIIRDERLRGNADPQKTATSFNLRHHNQHIPHTLPTVDVADYVVNTHTTKQEWEYDVYGRV